MGCQAVCLAPEAVAVAMERKERLHYQDVLSQPKGGGWEHELQGASAGLLWSLGMHRTPRFRMRAECSWTHTEGCLLHQCPVSLPAWYQITFSSFLKCHQPSQWDRKVEIQAGKRKEIDSACAQGKVRSKDQALKERNIIKTDGQCRSLLVKGNCQIHVAYLNHCPGVERDWLAVACPFLFLLKRAFGLQVPASHWVSVVTWLTPPPQLTDSSTFHVIFPPFSLVSEGWMSILKLSKETR